MKCEKLEVWKRACRLSIKIYKHFSSCKDFGFKDQITRSGLSIASNIAEGMEKTSNKDKNRFLDISKGSVAELITQIHRNRDKLYRKRDRFFLDTRIK